jgi:poly(3-hydroxybutyrate) depolymerase
MKLKKTLMIASGLILAVALIFLVYLSTGQSKPMPEALAAMKSDAKVAVTDVESIVFTPLDSPTDTALIIYPGGKVAPEAYAPIARAFAEQGIKTIIAKMPFNLAVFGINKADQIIAQNSDIKKWYISGHSLGGVMAARYVKAHQEQFDGLILWASYPEESSDFSQSAMPVMSIYGTNDGLTLPGDISDTMHLMPKDVLWISIRGANHSQFGWYGFQKGDEKADISREQQQQEIVEATMEIIRPNLWEYKENGN